MTSNDAQIDVLLRRYAGQPPSEAATQHMDADELNAFAEGSLPAAARARYVSHLVDCDNCRQIVSQLTMGSGVLVKPETETAADVQGYSWWKRLSGFFSPLTLRYAAFAMVLIAAAGLIFFVTRRERDSNLVALSDHNERAPESAVKPPGDSVPQTASQPVGNENKESAATPRSQVSPSVDQIVRPGQPGAGENPTASLKSASEAEATSNPLPAAEKKAEPVIAQAAPSYAPPPPVEGQRAETETRDQQNPKGLASASGPRKSAPADSFKMMDRTRAAEGDKDNRAANDNSRLAVNQPPASRRASDEKAKGPRRDAENNVRNRNSNEVQLDAAKTQSTVAPNRAASEEKPAETRSAGGRKFRRQGSAWVDAKFKTSMTLKSVSRGSSDFNELDSGLRAIGQQLGGEVIVVWKGKAYLIR